MILGISLYAVLLLGGWVLADSGVGADLLERVAQWVER